MNPRSNFGSSEQENSTEIEDLIKKQQWREELKKGDEVEILRKIGSDRGAYWDFEAAVVESITEDNKLHLNLVFTNEHVDVDRLS